jgi:23S rRNA-/tRNA-specific pseudouridylate synthase
MAVGPGRPALTRFRLIRHGNAPGGEPVSLLQLDLVTGRTHQIRVHLSHAGHPVCGDALYGGERPPLDRLFLHATRLAWPGTTPVVAPVPAPLSDLVG